MNVKVWGLGGMQALVRNGQRALETPKLHIYLVCTKDKSNGKADLTLHKICKIVDPSPLARTAIIIILQTGKLVTYLGLRDQVCSVQRCFDQSRR